MEPAAHQMLGAAPASSPIAFFDPGCASPYSAATLAASGLGGTEATVVRIAEALDARVVQHNRSAAEGRYLPAAGGADIEQLIVLRDPQALVRIGADYPNARRYLWVHDRMRPGSRRGARLAAAARALAELGVTILCVSEFQRRQVVAVLARAGVAGRVRTVTIYNPIDDALQPDGTPIDMSKLVFCSSPNKGLAFALDAFRAMRRQIPELRLRVGSPGYKQPRHGLLAGAEGVEWLGSLPHARILAEMRTALCVFHPNFVIPETFGLVFAEAHALGTPVLTHDCGAALEVLGDAREALPVSAAQRIYEGVARLAPRPLRRSLAVGADALGVFRPYLEQVRAWRSGARPEVSADPRFRLSAVIARWRALLRGELRD